MAAVCRKRELDLIVPTLLKPFGGRTKCAFKIHPRFSYGWARQILTSRRAIMHGRRAGIEMPMA